MTPTELIQKVRAILDQTATELQGEPVLVIGNGAAVVIYVVAKAFGRIPDVDFATALLQAGAAIAVVNTTLVTIRKYVSPVA